MASVDSKEPKTKNTEVQFILLSEINDEKVYVEKSWFDKMKQESQAKSPYQQVGFINKPLNEFDGIKELLK